MYLVFGILVVISTFNFLKFFVFLLKWKTTTCSTLGRSERKFYKTCPTMIYAQRGVGYEDGKGLKKLNNFIEPPV